MRENTEYLKKKKKKKTTNTNQREFTLGVKVNGSSKSDLEFALRKFKKIIKDSGVLLEYKDRQEFLKPSVVKRRKKLQAIRNSKSRYDEVYE